MSLNFDSPDQLISQLFASWRSAIGQREHPFYLLSLATVGNDHFPECRIVVLRQVHETLGEIQIQGDVRSPKIAQLKKDPRVTLLFYDPVRRVQIRCRGVASVHIGDALANTAWQECAPTSRAMYATKEGPSEEVEEHPFIPAIPAEDDAWAFSHFAAIVCRLTEIDVLELAREQNRRVLLRRSTTGWELQRLAP